METALGIGMRDAIGGFRRLGDLRLVAGGEFQQDLSSLLRKVPGEIEQGRFRSLADVLDPLGRYPVRQQGFLWDVREKRYLGGHLDLRLHIHWDFLN